MGHVIAEGSHQRTQWGYIGDHAWNKLDQAAFLLNAKFNKAQKMNDLERNDAIASNGKMAPFRLVVFEKQ